MFKINIRRRRLLGLLLLVYFYPHNAAEEFSIFLQFRIAFERSVNWRTFFRHSFHFSSRNCHVTFTLNFFAAHCFAALKMIDSFSFPHSTPLHATPLHSFAHIFVILRVCNVFISAIRRGIFRDDNFVCVFYFNTWCLGVYVNNVHQTISVAFDTTEQLQTKLIHPFFRFERKKLRSIS